MVPIYHFLAICLLLPLGVLATSTLQPNLISGTLSSLLKPASTLFIHIGQDLNELNDDRFCEKQAGCFFIVSLNKFPELAARICLLSPCSETEFPLSSQSIIEHINSAQKQEKFSSEDLVMTLNPKTAGNRNNGDAWMKGGAIKALTVACAALSIVSGLAMWKSYASSKATPKEGTTFLACFNPVQNLALLFSSPPDSDASLEIISWARVVAMGWIMFCHTVIEFLRALGPNTAPAYARIMSERVFTLLTGATVVADLFFGFSGFFSALTCDRTFASEKNRSVSMVLKTYLSRYLRLLPAYVSCLLIAGFIFPMLIQGEKFTVINKAECPNNWALNLVFLNNFGKSCWEQCFMWSWFIANDMQFFLLAPLLALLRHRMGRGTAYSLVLILAGLSAAIQLQVTYKYNIHLNISDGKMLFDQFDNYYVMPYCRINPYLVGTALAWLWSSGPKAGLNRLISQSWLVRYTIYSVGAALCFAVFWTYPEFYMHTTQPLSLGAAYTILSRPGFVLAIFCFLYPSMLGKGRLLRGGVLLFPKVWAVLGKLTYCSYILHVVIATYYVAAYEKEVRFEMLQIGKYFAAVSAISYAISFVVTVAVEQPAVRLTKMLLFPGDERRKTKAS